MMSTYARAHFLLLLAFLATPSFALEAVDGILEGKTYSIGDAFTAGDHGTGSHFHSSNLLTLPDDNPPINFTGVAEVGGFFNDEEVRGVSEFDIHDVTTSEATLTFEVFDLFEGGFSLEPTGVDGLFGQGSLEGQVDVFAYRANFVEELADYDIDVLDNAPILTIGVGPGLVEGGDIFSVDVTEVYNNLVTDGDELGIRIQLTDSDPDAGAITFHNFRLEVEGVPEPHSQLLALVGVLSLLRLRTRRE